MIRLTLADVPAIRRCPGRMESLPDIRIRISDVDANILRHGVDRDTEWDRYWVIEDLDVIRFVRFNGPHTHWTFRIRSVGKGCEVYDVNVLLDPKGYHRTTLGGFERDTLADLIHNAVEAGRRQHMTRRRREEAVNPAALMVASTHSNEL